MSPLMFLRTDASYCAGRRDVTLRHQNTPSQDLSPHSRAAGGCWCCSGSARRRRVTCSSSVWQTVYGTSHGVGLKSSARQWKRKESSTRVAGVHELSPAEDQGTTPTISAFADILTFDSQCQRMGGSPSTCASCRTLQIPCAVNKDGDRRKCELQGLSALPKHSLFRLTQSWIATACCSSPETSRLSRELRCQRRTQCR